MNIFQSEKKCQGMFALVVCLVFGVVTWYAFSRSSGERIGVRIGEQSFLVEVVDTPAVRERGLGGRSELPSGHGMLFLFPDMEPDRYAFWMKGMRFPLDIVWIRGGRVVHIERNIPADSEAIFRPPTEADSVLEVNAGELSRIVPGDMISSFNQ